MQQKNTGRNTKNISNKFQTKNSIARIHVEDDISKVLLEWDLSEKNFEGNQEKYGQT